MDFISTDCFEEVDFVRLTILDHDDWFYADTFESFETTADMWTSDLVDMGWSLMGQEHGATTTPDGLPAPTLWRNEHQDSNPSSKTERREPIPPAGPTVPPDHDLEMDSGWLEHIVERSNNPP
ncbi:hypothetical protein IFR05_009196 [Cadophora sp. M221]|nr:hypothetical protein IFR05_009196 [Cadophora sp. M221]